MLSENDCLTVTAFSMLLTDTLAASSEVEPAFVSVFAFAVKLAPIAIAIAQLKSDLFNFIIILLER